jgi:uncharacterized membrane protein YidH (DUF202 family)
MPWGLIIFVAVLNLWAIGVFAGHWQRFMRWQRELNRALSLPWQEVWQDMMERSFPRPDLSGGLYVAAGLIIALTLLGLFLVFVGSFG